MSLILSKFEQSMKDMSPTYLLRIEPDVLTQLAGGPLKAYVNKPLSEGPGLVPSDGVFARSSARFTGGDASTGKYIVVGSGNAIKPVNALSFCLVMSPFRNPTPSSGGFSIAGCAEGGGYVIFLYNTGNVYFQVFVNNVQLTVGFDRNLFTDGGNLIHGTFDGRYVKVFLNGNLQGTIDNNSKKSITYGSAALLIGVETIGGESNDANFADADVSLCGVYNFALTTSQIAEQYAVFSAQKALSGTALLDDGRPADSVVITDVVSLRTAAVAPSSGGAWQAITPPGDYIATAIGPAGYRPISHGPVTAVDL